MSIADILKKVDSSTSEEVKIAAPMIKEWINQAYNIGVVEGIKSTLDRPKKEIIKSIPSTPGKRDEYLDGIMNRDK